MQTNRSAGRFRSDERGATLVEAGLVLALVAAVCVGAITQLGNNAGSLETAGGTLDQPEQVTINSSSEGVIRTDASGTSDSGGTRTSGQSGSAFGITGAAITGVDVEDRGFEDGLTANWSNYTTGQTIGAWTVIDGDVDTHSTSAYQNGVGQRFIDLNGFGPGAIAQTIDVVPGVGYTLEVAVSENQCAESVKGMQVEWNGVTVSQLSVDLPRGEFRTYEIQLPPSSAPQAQLVFRGTSSRNCGVQIDEPSIRLTID